jgi:hypothetical protein
MNTRFLWQLAVALIVGTFSAHALPTYTCTVQNQVVVGTTFSFDLFVVRTGDAFDLGDCDLALTFNNGFFTAPVASAVGSIAGYAMGASFPVGIPNRVVLNVTAPGSGQFPVPLTDTKIATVSITGISTPSGTAGLQWHNTTLFQTYSGDDITGNGTFESSTPTPLPITLSSFTGQVLPNSGGVRLNWTTLTEINNYGFNVQRRQNTDSLFVDVPNSFIPGHGTTTEPHTYTYTDLTASSGAWCYRLKQMDLDGTVHYSEPIQVQVLTDVKELAPLVFALNQNYPNPFNPQSEIKFSVETTGRTTLQVYNIAGQLVATLFDGVAEAGQYYRVQFGGSGMASGVYIYRLQNKEKSDLKKMLLLK